MRSLGSTVLAKPRDVTYSMEQVAALLEAAWGRPERRHVFLYTLIALSTCGRSEAILDLHDHQIDRGLIYFLDPDRDQTSKRRSIVPIAPTLAPRSEEHTSELQSLMRISYAVFCLKKKTTICRTICTRLCDRVQRQAYHIDITSVHNQKDISH